MIGGPEIPNPPNGSSKEAQWHRKLLTCVRSLFLIDGPGYQVSRTTIGTKILLNPTFGGGGGTIDIRVVYFDSMFGDYLICANAPFATGPAPTNADLLRVAKPYILRNSIASTLIDGVSIVYTYPITPPSPYTQRYAYRQAVGNSILVNEVIVPRYNKYTVGINTFRSPIIAITASTGVVSVTTDPLGPAGTPVTLLDWNNDARMWSQTAT